MSNPLKAVGKALKSVAKAVKKVFKSPIFKAVAIGAAMFFGIPAAATALGVGAGAAGGAAAGGAGAWWSSTLGVGAGSAATTAAGSAFPASLTGITPMASTVANSAAGGILSSAAPAMTGSLGPAVGGGFSAAVGAGTSAATKAGTFGAGLGGTVGTETAKQGLIGKAISGFKGLDPMVQSSILQMGGNAVSGWASAKQKEAEQERLWDREDELKNRESAWGVRYDGERPLPDYNPGEMLNQLAQGYSPSYGNFLGVNPGQKKKAEGEEIFANYNPYWS